MNRRAFLRAGTAVATAATVAGCLDGLLGEGESREPPLVEDRPDAVYVPTHVDGMEMAGMASAGPYKLALSYSFPHRFWRIDGSDAEKVSVEDDDTVHLMGTLWDVDTKIVPPAGNLSMTVRKDGEVVDDRRMWPMLSQTMGFHFGDNVSLDGDGTYEIEVSVDPLGARTTGAFQGRFEEAVSTTVEVEYSERVLNETQVQMLDDRQGERDAVPPMEMDMPVSQLPAKANLEGELVGEGTSGDGVFLATVPSSTPRGVDGDGQYLAVSARTPYNRYPLARMALSGTVRRNSETVFDGALAASLDPDLDYHYGAAIDGLQSGDEVTLSVGAPPQVFRHEGYETAFLEFEDVHFTVP
ncbi:hypothetical protein BRC81_02245 [Halobacteriales archaeon QS_1_68_20]|nr:MAG: hypothetical protein BRC81_02245 [Halobacteriales archaeon QS_1_68_20]